MTGATSVTAPRCGDVYRSAVDGRTVLFNPRDRRLHVLNDSAAAVWDQLARTSTIGALTAEVAAVFGVEAHAIRLDVERTLDHFSADSLIGVDEPHPRPGPAVVPPTSAPAITVAALRANVAIHADDPDCVALLARLVAPLQRTPSSTIDDGWVSLAGDVDAGWHLTSSLGTDMRVGSRVGGALRVVSELNALAVASRPDDLVFHAGAVTADGGAVLLPGSSNRGKSTLTTALVQSGCGYLTDEAAVVDRSHLVEPFPKAISLDPGSFPLFPELAPTDDGPLDAVMARREWHVDPARVGEVASITPLAAVVCPAWRAGATTRLVRVTGTEALYTLLGDAFDFSAGGQRLFDRLTAVVASVPVYRLGYGDLSEAVASVRSVLADR